MDYWQLAVTETYEDVRLLIFDTVHKFHRSYGGDFEELVGDAHLIFMEVYNNFDPGRGTKFSTWLRLKIWYGLLEKARAQAKRRKGLHDRAVDQTDKRMSSINLTDISCIDLTNIPAVNQPTFSLLDFISEREISKDAVIVVNLVLNPPPGLGKIFEKSGWKRVRGCLREYLRGLGWTVARISESFSEIRQVL